jgi:hypothetical protein
MASSMLYLNMLAMSTATPEDGSIFFRSPWLNALVFGMNASSVLNSIGMMLLSGVFHDVAPFVTLGLVRKRVFSYCCCCCNGRCDPRARKKTQTKVVAAP